MTKAIAEQQQTATLSPVEELARAHEREAVTLFVETIRDKALKPEHRLRAAENLLDRARGKAKVNSVDPSKNKKRRAIELSEETLLKIVNARNGERRVRARTVKPDEVIDGEFTPTPTRKVPRNEHALPNPSPTAEDILS